MENVWIYSISDMTLTAFACELEMWGKRIGWKQNGWEGVKFSEIWKTVYTVLQRGSEKAMAPHSSTLPWKIPWMEEPGGPQSMGLLRVGQDSAASLWLFTFLHWRRQWQPTPVFLPGESQGQGEPCGLPSMGLHRVGHHWSNLAAAAVAAKRG